MLLVLLELVLGVVLEESVVPLWSWVAPLVEAVLVLIEPLVEPVAEPEAVPPKVVLPDEPAVLLDGDELVLAPKVESCDVLCPEVLWPAWPVLP